MTRLTCITTTYNEGAALLASVQSVLAQSFTDFQYILVDDGALPATKAVLATLDDPRILVIRQANDGLSSARNRALEQASGDYICFLDADDSRPNWSFATINRALERHAPDLLLCPGILQDLRNDIAAFYDETVFQTIADLIPGNLTQRGQADFARIACLAQQIEPQSANKVVSRSFLRNSAIGFPNTHFFEDIFFHTGLIAAADRIAFLDTPAFTYFRRYDRPQITATSGETRFGIIAVTKLTLEAFARRPEFHNTAHRAAVLASCMRLVEWCEASISHQHQASFRHSTQIMLAMIDPLYLHLPPGIPREVGNLDNLRHYIGSLAHAA